MRVIPGSVPKIGTSVEVSILSRVSQVNRRVGDYLVRNSRNRILYTRKLRYFVQFFDFVPEIIDSSGARLAPTELKSLDFSSDREKQVLLSVLNSSLFFWFFVVFSDCRNVNRREIVSFPLDPTAVDGPMTRRLLSLSKELMLDFRQKSALLEMNYENRGKLLIQTFQPRLSKSLLDEIDRAMSAYYHFNDEELDFIINHDIKYRMGQSADEDEDEDEE